MAEETRRDWETIQEDVNESKTQRLKVIGGWLYRVVMKNPVSVVIVFVPTRD